MVDFGTYLFFFFFAIFGSPDILMSFNQDMARLYPNSQFIGIDMADVFVTDNLPPNVSFQILNAGTGLDYFEDESFDFVFQRFLVMGFSTEQYIRSVQEMKRILKKSGVIEVLELVNDYKNAGPAFKNINLWSMYKKTNISKVLPFFFLYLVNQALVARNMDSFIADKISMYLSNAGYQNIRDINYDVPIGHWGGKPGDLYLAIQRLALPAVKVMITELTAITSEQYDENLAKAFEEVDHFNISTRFRLVYANK